MAAKIIDKKKKKKEILLAALKVFSEKGISSVTIKDIADKAKVGKGTIYEYFNSKKEIIYSAFSMFLEGGKYSMGAINNLLEPPDKRLREGLELFSEEVNAEGSQTFELFFDFWAIGIQEKKYRSEFYYHLKDFYARYRKTFSNIVKEGQKKGVFNTNFSSESIGAMIIGMLDGLMAQWLLDKENIDYPRVIRTMVEIIISGLKSKYKEEQ